VRLALETLKHVKEIGGFRVMRRPPNGLGWIFDPHIQGKFPICIVEEESTISFKIQSGPIKSGLNGCQVGTMIETAKIILKGLNRASPCQGSTRAIECLEEAVSHLQRRKSDLVEGASKV